MWTINNVLLMIVIFAMLVFLGQYKSEYRLAYYLMLAIFGVVFFSISEGWLILPGYIGYIGFAAIIIFYGIPYGLSRLLMRACAKADWKQAQKYARWISWLHPSIEWRKAPLLYQVFEMLDHDDDSTAAEAILQQLQNVKGSWISVFARQSLYRVQGRWSELVHELQPAPDAEIQPHHLALYLEALGETGDLNELVAAFQRYQPALQKLDDSGQRHAYMFLFTFVGRPDLVDRVIEPIKHTLTSIRASYIKATAELVAGNSLPMQAMLEEFDAATWPESRASFERRLNNPPPSPATLSAENKARLLEIEQNWGGYVGSAQGQRYVFGKRP